MKALLLPLDDRPVTYAFPQMLCRVAGVSPLAPPRKLMGSLAEPASSDALSEWLSTTVKEEKPDALILCADSLLYGGLINSRRSTESAKPVLERVGKLARLQPANSGRLPLFVQSSIMRISDNYDATEEKKYWSEFGREIFAWSGYLHRLARGGELAPGVLSAAEFKIPAPVREDYLSTRRRNLQVNRSLIELVESRIIDLLVFSLDDSGEYGLNVHEKERLLAEARERSVSDRVLSYPGADEVICTLIARWLIEQAGRPPRIDLIFSPTGAADCMSRYEGQRIGETVRSQIKAAGIELDTIESDKAGKADFLVVVHGREEGQGDHILLPEHPDLRNLDTTRSVKSTLAVLENASVPVVLCDVAYANGADPALMKVLLENWEVMGKLWGYAGWNTTGNTVGSALATGIARWFGVKHAGHKDHRDLERCLFVRIADDWGYQSNIRRTLSGPVSADALAALMEPSLQSAAKALNSQPGVVRLKLPWQRTFEIEVDVDR